MTGRLDGRRQDNRPRCKRRRLGEHELILWGLIIVERTKRKKTSHLYFDLWQQEWVMGKRATPCSQVSISELEIGSV